jgi:hypothetical protein
LGVAILTVVAVAGVGCTTQRQTPDSEAPRVKTKGPISPYARARVTFFADPATRKETRPPVDKTVVAPDEILRLLSFFPKAGSGQKSDIVFGWKPVIDVNFFGEGSHLFVSSELDVWTELSGDFSVRDPQGLKRFCCDLFNSPEPAKGSCEKP